MPVGRPIISGCEGPTERISSFVDHLLQPIAQKQKSYLKDTTDFINFIEKTEVSQNTILVSMDVTSLYTNIPQDDGITIVCEAYDKYQNNSPPIPSHYLKQILGLILKEIRSSSTEKTISKFTERPWQRKWRSLLPISSWQKSKQKCLMKAESSRKYRNVTQMTFSLYGMSIVRTLTIEQAKKFHPTIKFTAEISEKEITFLDTVVYEGERFLKEVILPDVKTHYKPTETFQYTHYSSCHPPGVKRGFIEGEAIRLLRTNSSKKKKYQEAMCNFKTQLEACGYPKNLIERKLSEVSFAGRQSALKKQTKETKGKIMPFVTTYHPWGKKLKKKY